MSDIVDITNPYLSLSDPSPASRRSSDAGPPRNEAERQQRYQECKPSKSASRNQSSLPFFAVFNANRLSVPDVRVPEINETIGANATSSRRPAPPPRPALPLARRSGALPALPPSGPIVLEEIAGKRLYSLTNPAACVIKYQDQQYPSASHLFHAMKVRCSQGQIPMESHLVTTRPVSATSTQPGETYPMVCSRWRRPRERGKTTRTRTS